MAAIIVALVACAYTNIMDRKEKKRQEKEQEDVQARLQDIGSGGGSSIVNPMADGSSGPSAARARDPRGESLRAKAARRLHGQGVNPSQLGDPISLTAETENEDAAPSNERRHLEDEAGSRPDSRATTLRGSGEGYERRSHTTANDAEAVGHGAASTTSVDGGTRRGLGSSGADGDGEASGSSATTTRRRSRL